MMDLCVVNSYRKKYLGANFLLGEVRAATAEKLICIRDLLKIENLVKFSGSEDLLHQALDDIGNTIFSVASVILPQDEKQGKLELLLRFGADINAVNLRGKSALTFAIEANDIDLARFLLENGAVANAIDIFHTFFSNDNGVEDLEKLLHIMPTVNALCKLDKSAIDVILTDAMMHLVHKKVQDSIYSSTLHKFKDIMALIIASSGSQMKIFMNNHFAKLILKSNIDEAIVAFFEHNLLNDCVKSFSLDSHHPLIASMVCNNVVALKCIMKTALVASGPVQVALKSTTFAVSYVDFELEASKTVTPLGFILLCYHGKEPKHREMLTLLLDANLPLGNEEFIVSPLTLFLVCCARLRMQQFIITNEDDYEQSQDMFNESLPTLLARTKNFDQQVLKIEAEEMQNLALLKNNFNLPDALMIATLSMNMRAVVNLLQYWHHTPAYLAMILGENRLGMSKTSKLRAILVKIAKEFFSFGLPNGKINKFQTNGDDEVLRDPEIQAQLRGTVCSLQHLAVYTIRENCKVRGSDLPAVLAPLVPRGLHSLLLLQPRENVTNNLEKLAREYLHEKVTPPCSNLQVAVGFGRFLYSGDYDSEYNNDDDEDSYDCDLESFGAGSSIDFEI